MQLLRSLIKRRLFVTLPLALIVALEFSLLLQPSQQLSTSSSKAKSGSQQVILHHTDERGTTTKVQAAETTTPGTTVVGPTTDPTTGSGPVTTPAPTPDPTPICPVCALDNYDTVPTPCYSYGSCQVPDPTPRCGCGTYNTRSGALCPEAMACMY